MNSINYEIVVGEFTNKNYFNKLFSKYNYWVNKKHNKDNIFSYALLSVVSTIIISFLGSFVYLNAYLLALGIGLLVFSVISIIFFDTVFSKNEIRQLDEIENSLFKDVKVNELLLKDLSKLIVDETTETIFYSMLQKFKNNEEKNFFNELKDLIHSYNSYVEKKEFIENKKELFKEFGVGNSKLESPVFKPSKTKFLEML